jgi:aldehyde dehydrogenase (NAD+)
MLIHKDSYDKAVEIAAAVAGSVKVQDPKTAEQGAIGPVANGTQFKKINGLLQKGIDEGAKAVVGGPGRPEGMTSGYYVRPTIFANVSCFTGWCLFVVF